MWEALCSGNGGGEQVGGRGVVVIGVESESEVGKGVRMLEVNEKRKEKHAEYDERARKI